jgi:hypothetical protein
MSYERKSTVIDGEEVIREGDITERNITKGPILYAVDEHGKARPVMIATKELQIADQDARDVLSSILKELKKLNDMIEIMSN